MDEFGVSLEDATEDQRFKLGQTCVVGRTKYIYLKNRSSATGLGEVFAYDPASYTLENLASNANLTGQVRPIAVFNRNRNQNPNAERVPINYLQYSEQFDNAAWTKDDTTCTANDTTAPDGQLTGDLIVANSVYTAHYVYSASSMATIIVGQSYRFAASFKYSNHRYVQLYYQGTSNHGITIDLVANKITARTSGVTSASIVSDRQGWYRAMFTTTATNTILYPTVAFADAADASLASGIATAGTEAFYLWGMSVQLESDSDVYVATTTTGLTANPNTAVSIPASYYAWAAIEGELEVTVLASCARRVPLYTSATAGYLDDTSTSQTLIEGASINATNPIAGTRLLAKAYAIQPMRS